MTGILPNALDEGEEFPHWRRNLAVLWFAQFISLCGFSLSVPFALSRMAALADPLMRKVREVFFNRRLVRDTTLAVTTLAILIVLYIVLSYLISYLAMLSMRIPF